LERLALDESYRERGVRAAVIDVLESEEITRAWAARCGFTLPVLMDADGKVAESFAPAGVLPELPRNQIPIASNLIIDREGRIRFYELLDSRNFDAQLIRLKARLDELLAAEGSAPAEAAPPIAALEWPAVKVPPGGTVHAAARIQVDPEHHVMANPASQDYLVPLRLSLGAVDGVRPGTPVYPAGTPFLVGGDTLATYEGEITVSIPVTAAADAAPGVRTLRGTLEIQGCSRHACRMPAEIVVEVNVEVTAPGG